MKMMTFGGCCIASLFLMLLFGGCSSIKFSDMNASKNAFDLEDVAPKPAINFRVWFTEF